MKICAVIAEYNPFHNGHLKQLRAAKRETQADALIVLMSGSFTQHGDVAIADRSVRANWAIEAGADLVLELPTVYSLAPAHIFAKGAVKTLSMLGEFTLSFGTETEELEQLSMAAEFMNSESKDMRQLLKGYLNEGYSVAKSRTMALDVLRPDVANMLHSPNNILAVEYIKAAAAYGDKITLHNVERRPDDGHTRAFACGRGHRSIRPALRLARQADRHRKIQHDLHLRTEVKDRGATRRTRQHKRGNGKPHIAIGFQQYGRISFSDVPTLHSLHDKTHRRVCDCGVDQGSLRARRQRKAILHGACRPSLQKENAFAPARERRRIFLFQTQRLRRGLSRASPRSA